MSEGGTMRAHVERLARKFDDLPRELYGKITLHVEAGRVQRAEIVETIRTPPRGLDKPRGRA